MAKIVSQTFVVTVNRLARDNEAVGSLVTEDFAGNLEAVVQELVGTGAVVEVVGVDND
jgi:hypothetical protein